MRPGSSREKKTPSLPDSALLERLGVSLDGGQRRALQAYGELVGRWNPVAGLVAADDLPRFASRHLLDSLVLAPLIRSPGAPG